MTIPDSITAPAPTPSLAAKLTSWGGRNAALVPLCMLAGSFMTADVWWAAWTCVGGVGLLLGWSLWISIHDHKIQKQSNAAFWDLAKS